MVLLLRIVGDLLLWLLLLSLLLSLLLRWRRCLDLLDVGRLMLGRSLRVGMLWRRIVALGWRLGGCRLVRGVRVVLLVLLVLRVVLRMLGVLRVLRMLRVLGMLLVVNDARSRVVDRKVGWRRQALRSVGVMLEKHVGLATLQARRKREWRRNKKGCGGRR